MAYNEFIQNIINTRGQWNIPKGTYYEVHHILPVCMGGLPKRHTKSQIHQNLIWLTPKEHFIAHKLLAQEHLDNYKLMYAWKQMWLVNAHQERYEPSPEEFEEYKLLSKKLINAYKPSEETKKKISESNKGKHNKALSDEQKKYLSEINIGELNPNYGLKRSNETKQKISIANKGRKASAETKQKLSKVHLGNTSALGHKHSDESKQKIGEASRNRIIKQETKEKISKNMLGNTYTKGMKWFNNGLISRMFLPGTELPGFVLGRLPKVNKE